MWHQRSWPSNSIKDVTPMNVKCIGSGLLPPRGPRWIGPENLQSDDKVAATRTSGKLRNRCVNYANVESSTNFWYSIVPMPVGKNPLTRHVEEGGGTRAVYPCSRDELRWHETVLQAAAVCAQLEIHWPMRVVGNIRFPRRGCSLC